LTTFFFFNDLVQCTLVS